MHLIGPLVAREAAVSSKIEGTQSTSSDIYILMLVVFLLMESPLFQIITQRCLRQ